jgi:hypothetical protein|tara:strand:+ start:288 stop:941 length:654 start_codon:yes stop_codon:yes gene_type:complete
VTYPITIVDDFFEDPDAIVKMANELKYYPPDTGNWPGMRTKQLHVVEDRFFQYFGEKIMLLFHDNTPEYWKLQSHFQKILPFHEDQYDKLNRGWIHQDLDTYFGGIVYLTKDPEPDTGTSIYKTTTGFAMQYASELKLKERKYRGEEVDREEYCKAYDAAHAQYKESVKIENVYNRFVMFNNKTHHGVQTFGTKERLTLNFFGMEVTGKKPPLVRSR